jgi:hypothetical protein
MSSPLRRGPSRRAFSVLLLAMVGLGFGLSCERFIYFDDARPVQQGCTELQLSAGKCAALVAEAQETLKLEPSQIASTQILIEDRCGDLREQVCTRSGGFVGGALFRLSDGRMSWTTVTCVPGSVSKTCNLP